jgi:hypothetical protein
VELSLWAALVATPAAQSALVLGEPLGPRYLAGCAAVIAGIITGTYDRDFRATEKALPGRSDRRPCHARSKNPARHGELENVGAATETKLRDRVATGGKPALKAHPVIAAYERYYNAFKKTCHITLQLDSVIWKDRDVPFVSAVVNAMFIA